MKLFLDRYAHLDSPIHRWQQSYKLVGLLGLIFAFAFIQKLFLLPIIIVITSIIFILSGLPLSFLLSRLRYPGLFILAVVIFLPFMAGSTVLFSWGWLSLKQEGLLTSLLISVRFFCILTVSLVLFGTAPFLNTMKAIRTLGLPKTIVDMTMLTYRYLEELGAMLATMQRAMKLRGFQPKNLNRRNLKIFAQLAGSLLIRSYEKSQRVYQAMILRGYGSNLNYLKKFNQFRVEKNNLIATIISLIVAVSLIVAEILLTENIQ